MALIMGSSIRKIFRSGSEFLSNRDGHKISDTTVEKMKTVFEILRANPKISIHTLEGVLLQIPKVFIISL